MLKLFNSYTRKSEEFKPLKGKTVTMYNCGPTVYDFAHIGNLRTFLFADILRRWIEYSGYNVKQVMNITDVGHALGDADIGGDKIEEGAKREGLSPLQVARKYETAFKNDIKRLNIKPAYKYPRASEHIPEMISVISKLLANGVAYKVDGDIYFDISKFPKYGTLSGNTVEALNAGARVEVNPKKKNPNDFALWIYNPNHLMQWKAPWGSGYPGWHIECSAMATKYLGKTIDIHTGGEDNKFPHHECEIAQSESAFNKQFARFWMHASFILVDGKKMSKSLNNFYKVDDLIAKGYSFEDIRYCLISCHYREQQNFTFDSLSAAKKARERINEFYTRLSARGGKENVINDEMHAVIESAKSGFNEAMNDDLNVPKALAVVFDLIRLANGYLDKNNFSVTDKAKLKKFVKHALVDALGIKLTVSKGSGGHPEALKLIKERENAKKDKNFVLADELRNKIKVNFGIELKDERDGTTTIVYTLNK